MEVEVTNSEINVGVQPLLDILVKRASDKVASVRAKALTDLGIVIQLVDENPMLRTDILSTQLIIIGLAYFLNAYPQIESLLDLHPSSAKNGSDKTHLLSVLQRRIVDEKATVRKAAIQVCQYFPFFCLTN